MTATRTLAAGALIVMSMGAFTSAAAEKRKALEERGRRCLSGDVASCYSLGVVLEDDEPKQALRWYMHGCEAGDPASCGGAGWVRWRKLHDSVGALPLLEGGCANGEGHPRACANLGNYLWRVEDDVAGARDILFLACSVDSEFGCGRLGALEKEQKNYREARAAWEVSCRLGSRWACMTLAVQYTHSDLDESIWADYDAHEDIWLMSLPKAGGVGAGAGMPSRRVTREEDVLRAERVCRQGDWPYACLWAARRWRKYDNPERAGVLAREAEVHADKLCEWGWEWACGAERYVAVVHAGDRGKGLAGLDQRCADGDERSCDAAIGARNAELRYARLYFVFFVVGCISLGLFAGALRGSG